MRVLPCGPATCELLVQRVIFEGENSGFWYAPRQADAGSFLKFPIVTNK